MTAAAQPSDTITIQIRMMVSECQICGEQSAFHHAVLGAGGAYCKAHAPIAAAMAKHHSDMHFARGMANGVITLPTLWWPKRTVVDRPTCIPKVAREALAMRDAIAEVLGEKGEQG